MEVSVSGGAAQATSCAIKGFGVMVGLESQ